MSEEEQGKAPPAAAQGRWARRLVRAGAVLGAAAVAFFVVSLLWAGVYRFLPPPGTLVMLERQLAGEKIDKRWTPLEAISPHLIRAVIAAEDTRFCRHQGIDIEAIEKALDDNRINGPGGRRRGGSTISQQTAKNLFLWNGGGWARKAAEAWFTLVIETMWPKRRVMEAYLNVAEWGDGIFGAEAAARRRFGKGAADLTKGEAALLAAVLPSPNKWRIDPPGPYVRRRTAMLRVRMDVVARDGLAACVIPA